MKQTQIVVLLALVVLLANAHDMTKTNHRVQGDVTFFSWGLDLFRLWVLWPIPYLFFILPLGWVLALVGWPDSYSKWYSGMVSDLFALTVMI